MKIKVKPIFSYIPAAIRLIRQDYILLIPILIWAYMMNVLSNVIIKDSTVFSMSNLWFIFLSIFSMIGITIISVNQAFNTVDLVKKNLINIRENIKKTGPMVWRVLLSIVLLSIPLMIVFGFLVVMLALIKTIWISSISNRILAGVVAGVCMIALLVYMLLVAYIPCIVTVFNLPQKHLLRSIIRYFWLYRDRLILYMLVMLLLNLGFSLIPLGLKEINIYFFNLLYPLITGSVTAVTLVAQVLIIIDLPWIVSGTQVDANV